MIMGYWTLKVTAHPYSAGGETRQFAAGGGTGSAT